MDHWLKVFVRKRLYLAESLAGLEDDDLFGFVYLLEQVVDKELGY